MDTMMNSTPKPRSGLPRAVAAALLLAAPLCLPLRPALAEETPKSDTAGRDQLAGREQMEQRLKAAQERMEQAAHEMAEMSLSLNGGQDSVDRRVKIVVVRRPMLGMSIAEESGGARAGAGVRVLSVSPGGSAEAAGIRANDEIMSLNGGSLHGDAKRTGPEQLHAIMKLAKSGEPMAIEYQRDGKTYKAKIVPKDAHDMHEDLDLPPLPEMLTVEGRVGDAMTRVMHLGMRNSSGFGAAEMVDLSPALGSYFGTEKGLLVVRAPKDQRFKLQDGDVLVDIDGRVPGSVAHALQILASYRTGETVRLHILRQKQRLELSVEVPEG
ncbi:MAG TPA: PDZ domain-containing protein [Steroidobacteraceae bacterium]|nr:PDZ domain-containing protein [Steroidobacteraceae bacterium]